MNLRGDSITAYGFIWSHDEKIVSLYKFIYQYDQFHKLIKKWCTLKEILDAHPLYSEHTLKANLGGNIKTAYGFVWSYDRNLIEPEEKIFVIDEKYILEKDVFNVPDNNEYWKNMIGYENRYLISNYGQVYSLLSQKILATSDDAGYISVKITNSKGKRKSLYSHIIVALHFIKQIDPEKNVVNHIDENKSNSHYLNLEWVTSSINSLTYQKNKIRPIIIQYTVEDKLIKEWKDINEIMEHNKNYCRTSILKCLNDSHKTGVIYGFKWKHKDETINIKMKEKIRKNNISIDGEIWKNIGIIKGNNYSAYEISSHGRLRNSQTKRILILALQMAGYYFLPIPDDKGNRKNFNIHKLVALSFCTIPSDNKKYVVNHIDKNRANNNYKNLEWITQRDNVIHSKGIKVHQLDKDTGKIIKTFNCIADAAKAMNSNNGSAIVNVCKGRASCITACGYKWSYADE